jgi:hypothetical protein
MDKCSTAGDWILPIESYRYGLDWLSYSVPIEVGLRAAVPDHPAFKSTGEKVRPRRGYQVAMSLQNGRIDWAPDRVDQKIGVLLTGSDLLAVQQAGVHHHDLLDHLVRVGGKVSRVDFAADVFLPADPDDLYRAWQSGQLGTRAQKVVRVVGESLDGQPEKTFYVGSGASERLLRAYSKGLQVGAPFDWTRIELEMKKNYAYMWTLSACYHGIVPAGCEAIRDFCSPDVVWYQSALAGGGGYLTPVGRKDTDTDRWLVHQVRPVLCRRLRAWAAAGRFDLLDLFDFGDFFQEVGNSVIGEKGDFRK